MKAKQLTVLIKPASGLCQLSCRYCFYRDLIQFGDAPLKIMKPEIVSELIYKVADSLDTNGHVIFAFQGGEPLLAGVDFYKQFFTKVRHAKLHATYLFQTNGVALCTPTVGDAFIQLFKENNCLVGLSVDGEKNTHDANRVTPEGEGTFDCVMQAYKKLVSAGIEVNFLTVLSEAVLSHPEQLYVFYKNSGIKYVQLIPCLPPIQEKTNPIRDLLAPFWIKFHDMWRKDFVNNIPPFEVREFTAIYRGLAGIPVDTCIFPGKCSPQLIVEADGSLYPCDFYVLPQYCTGSILTDTLEDTLHSEGMIRFAKDNPPLPVQCLNCTYMRICKGGCRRMRSSWHPELGNCPMKLFLDHIVRR